LRAFFLLILLIGFGSTRAYAVSSEQPLRIYNRLRDINIVSVYFWSSGDLSKGCNLLGSSVIEPDSCFVPPLPGDTCNLMLWDELGNSYGFENIVLEESDDSLGLDLQHLEFLVPNVDRGPYPLRVLNSLDGFALDRFYISAEDSTGSEIDISEHRIFPGRSIVVWLEEGTYSLTAEDQTGRLLYLDRIEVGSSRGEVSLSEENVAEPVSIRTAGSGSFSLRVRNCLPGSNLMEILLIPLDRTGAVQCFLDDSPLLPGEELLIRMDSFDYLLEARDDHDGIFSYQPEPTVAHEIEWSVTWDYLDLDFSFPQR
jgi:hypothetical protein